MVEVEVERRVTHMFFTQDTRVHIPGESKVPHCFPEPKHIVFVLKREDET